ncbi:MAG: polysaccharide biosynthesis protein [Sphingobacteriaceae bacterium]
MDKHLRILPRWIIFSIDLCCVTASVYLAFLLRLNFRIQDFYAERINHILLITLAVYALVFVILRSYAGIIRYTSIQDSARILIATVVSSTTLVFFNMVGSQFENIIFIPYSVIVIIFFCSFLFLLSYRLIIKQIFENALYGKTDKRSVVIYGAGTSGITTKKVIHNDRESNLRVVGFIDDDTNKTQKKLDGVIIYNGNLGLDRLHTELHFKQLIIAVQNISNDKKNALVDWCLAHHVKVLTAPPSNQWMDGEFRTQQIKDIKIEDLLNRDTIKIRNEVIANQLQGKILLVTGAAGSIGSEIVRQVARFKPGMIVLCDQAESPLHDITLEMKEAFPDINVQPYIADIRNRARLRRMFEKFRPHQIYHAAAYKHVPVMEDHPSESISNNVLGTKNVAELAVEFKAEKFVMISTDKAVNPTNVMGASKRIAEIYIQALNNYLVQSLRVAQGSDGDYDHPSTRFITTRFGNVLGSNGSVIPRFKAQIEKGGPITVTHESITRYFMTIPEACQLVLEAGSMGEGGEIFVFDMGSSVKIADLAKKMIKLSGLELDKDIKIVYTGLRPGEKLYEELLNNSESTKPTYHEKIMIAEVQEYNFDLVNNDINDLIDSSRRHTDDQVVGKMKKIVPEFKSNNSRFEMLDAVSKKLLESPVKPVPPARLIPLLPPVLPEHEPEEGVY